MRLEAMKAAAGQMPKTELRDMFTFLLSQLATFAMGHVDVLLDAIADALDGLVERAPAMVRLLVGFATAALRFAASRMAASTEPVPTKP